MLNIYDAQDCVGADGEFDECTSCNCMNCAAVNQSNGFAEAAQMSVVKPGNVDHVWPIGDDLELPIASRPRLQQRRRMDSPKDDPQWMVIG